MLEVDTVQMNLTTEAHRDHFSHRDISGISLKIVNKTRDKSIREKLRNYCVQFS